MKARGPGGGWLAQNYDKLALALMLAVLLISTLFLIVRVGQKRQTSDGASGVYAGPHIKAVEITTTNFDASLSQLNNPFQVPAAGQRLAVGELRVSCVVCSRPIPFDAMVCPFEVCKAKQPDIREKRDSDADGIPDEDEQKLGLNPQDASDAIADVDGDKYSNIEEFKAGTLLNDAESHPTSIAKVRLVRAIVDPFRLRFLGTTQAPGGDRYQLNLKSLDRTYFAKMGEKIEGFLVSSIETNTGLPALVLTQGDKSYRLVQGRVINEESLPALLVFLLDNSRYRVRINESLKLPGKSYKVVDIKEDRVVVRDEETAASFTILRLSEDDRNQLQQRGVDTSVPSP